jgi:Arm DNA-binding domain/Phage integrase, N-terminal SAM-like domain
MANVKRHGWTYTYYVYVTDADGRRRQHSKGGFRTQRAAEAARVDALSALANGTYVKAERISLADYLTDEWLPFRRPPVLEESTWHSYDRYLRLHVIPHIGAVLLQKLTPVDLNRLYRHLLESGRRPVSAPAARRPAVRTRAVELRAAGLTYEQVAVQLREEFADEDLSPRTRSPRSCGAQPRRPSSPTGQPASRRAPCATSIRFSTPRSKTLFDGTGSCATSPMPPLPHRRPPLAQGVRKRRQRSSCENSSNTPPTASTCRSGFSSPRVAAGAVSASASGGPTSTSTRRRLSSPAE